MGELWNISYKWMVLMCFNGKLIELDGGFSFVTFDYQRVILFGPCLAANQFHIFHVLFARNKMNKPRGFVYAPVHGIHTAPVTYYVYNYIYIYISLWMVFLSFVNTATMPMSSHRVNVYLGLPKTFFVAHCWPNAFTINFDGFPSISRQ